MKRMPLSLVALLVLASPAFAEDAASLTDDAPTVLAAMETAGINVVYQSDDNENAMMELEYRPVGGSWKEGHQGLRGHAFYRSGKVEHREFAARLFYLKPRAEYEVRVTLSDPDGVKGNHSRAFKVTTRQERVVANQSGNVWHVDPKAAPGGDGSDRSPLNNLREAFAKVAAGDTVLLHDGTYALDKPVSIKASGTATAPIVVKAAEDERLVRISHSYSAARRSVGKNRVKRGSRSKGISNAGW